MCFDERFEAIEVAVAKRRIGRSSLSQALMSSQAAKDLAELMSGFGEAAHPPVIFLDIDGVLNRTSGATHIRLDQDLVSRLRTIVARSGCRIVLSTFWRGFDTYVRYILHRMPHRARTPA